MKTRFARVACSVAAFALLAMLAPQPVPAADPFEIDAILSLTGPIAFLGNAEALSLRTVEPIVNAAGGINGRPVRFVIQDDASQPSVAVQLANGIIAKRVSVILGPTYVASCLAIAPLVRANGPVDYCFAPTIHPPPGSYQFSGGASSFDQAREAFTFMAAKGWKRLAAIATSDATGQDVEDSYAAFAGKGAYAAMTFVANERFAPGDVSVAAQIAKIKAANPDVILLMTIGTATGTVLRDLKDAGLDNVPVLTNLGNLLRGQLAQQGSVMPPRTYFTAPRFYAHDVARPGPVRDAQQALYDAFRAQGVTPDVGNGFPWDPALIVIEALRKVGTNADAKALRDYILGVHGFAGTNGIYDYRDGSQRGQGLTALVMVQWDPVKKSVFTVSEPGGKPLPGH
jgi:branched-chain amino acid transport system substrate-binding protein